MNLDLKSGNSFYQTILPVISPVFVVYTTIGMALGSLPAFVQNKLGYSSFIVGLVIGLESVATLFTRAYSGRITDTKGPKKSQDKGVFLNVIVGIVYLLAISLVQHPLWSLVLLLFGRLIHGVSESLLITGTLVWGIGLSGNENSGKVMTWNGLAIYGGLALGAPLSIWLTKYSGISSVYIVMAILPLFSWLSTRKLPLVSGSKNNSKIPFYKVVRKVSIQGIELGLASVASGCISSFLVLLFMEKNWANASLAYIVFGVSYILPRLFLSSLPDKHGGFIITTISLIVEIIGQLFIAFASSQIIVFIGCVFTGVGFSLIYPALGVMVIKKVSPQIRGTALGAYAAFLDLSLALTIPIAGWVAGIYNYQATYFFGAIAGIAAIVLLLIRKCND